MFRNKNRCQVQIGGDARQVRVGVLMGTEGGNAVITPSACFLGITPQKGMTRKNVNWFYALLKINRSEFVQIKHLRKKKKKNVMPGKSQGS